MGFAHKSEKPQIVVAQLGQHVIRRDVFGIIVYKALPATYVPDRMDGAASDFARALGDCIRHRENLVTLFIQHQMMVSEVYARHVPMKVFGLEVERKNVGQQYSEGS